MLTDKTKFRKVRTFSDIENDPRIEMVDKDEDGYWAYFNPGWVSDSTECVTMRGDTVPELCERVNYSSPSYCKSCNTHMLGNEGWPNKSSYSGYLCDQCNHDLSANNGQ